MTKTQQIQRRQERLFTTNTKRRDPANLTLIEEGDRVARIIRNGQTLAARRLA